MAALKVVAKVFLMVAETDILKVGESGENSGMKLVEMKESELASQLVEKLAVYLVALKDVN